MVAAWQAALVASVVTCLALAVFDSFRQRREKRNRSEISNGIVGLIGHTPLVRIKSLCDATGCEILAKAEFINPGGSSKDRVALQIIRDAEAEGRLRPGGTIVEGTSGSTGISLALLARALGYQCHIVMPDDQATEKAVLLRQFGATVQLVKPVSIVHADHYVNMARRVVEQLNSSIDESDNAGTSSRTGSAIFCDQFETPSNFKSHYLTTGPEIWHQTRGQIDAFIMGAGTGGTLAGVAAYLKERRPAPGALITALVDPPGSSIYNKVVHGVAYASQQAERGLRRHRYDTIIEGVGIDRVTRNFDRGLRHIDAAFQCSDAEAVAMSRHLLAHDGLFVGSSTAMNCVGAVKLARRMGPGHTIVTVLCDSGMRHLSRFWNNCFLESVGLKDATGAGIAAITQ